MDFIQLAKKRYSVRAYKEMPVEREKLEKVLEAAKVAPTACNLQPFHLYVVQGKAMEKIEKSARTYGGTAAVIVCADKDKAWTRKYDGMQTTDIDASIVTDHMMLEATELGLGSLWVCWFKPDVLREEFQIPKHLIPINLLVLGYAEGEPLSPERHKETRASIESLTTFIE